MWKKMPETGLWDAAAPQKDVQPEAPGYNRQFGSAEKTARFDPNATECADCGRPLDGLKVCRYARNGQQFCGIKPDTRLSSTEKKADTADNPANEKGGEGAMLPKTDKEKAVTATKKNVRVDPATAQQMIESIRPGDSVTILIHAGGIGKNIEWREATGRAVMTSSHGGWVLNMGGRHGTPGIADVDNIIKVRKARRASDEEAAEHVASLLQRPHAARMRTS
jgi:hypothetical protein